MPDLMRQEAPYPVILEQLVDTLAYRPGWRFALDDIDRGQGSKGLTFIVVSLGYDTYNPQDGERYRVQHYFPVPPAAFNEVSWRRWILDRMLEIERHEAAEFLQFDGERLYAPVHGPGFDPYIIFDHTNPDDVRIRFDGSIADTDAAGRAVE